MPSFITAFIPILVAMDAVGILPLYISMIESLSQEKRRKVLFEAVLTVSILGTVFIFLGRGIFKFLGITVPDFMVAGGLILLILSITDLLFPDKTRHDDSGSVGVVPLGVPLIVGPATLTTLIVQADLVGMVPTLAAFIANLVITTIIFLLAIPIMKVIGKGGTQAFSKIANLFLSAIAIMLIRKGLSEIF